MRIKCITKFDITATGVSGNHSRNRLPFIDAVGTSISDVVQWEHSRNQQRNWETLQQILNLRTLLESITEPRMIEQKFRSWEFEFEIERASSLEINGDPLGALKIDSEGVPMILGLGESKDLENYLIYDRNIYFEIIDK